MIIRPFLKQAVLEMIARKQLVRVPNDAPLDFYKRHLAWERSRQARGAFHKRHAFRRQS